MPRKKKSPPAPLLPFDEEQIEALIPQSVIRTESVFSKRPVHLLQKTGVQEIDIVERDEKGKVNLQWRVTFNPKNIPRQLSYKIDRLIIDQRIDEYRKRRLPIPKVIKLGTLREIAEELGLNGSGANLKSIKNALIANSETNIWASLKYKGRDNTEKAIRTEANFHRYSVVFTGNPLDEQGSIADATYVVFDLIYHSVLNNALDRPLDYDYLKLLPPGPQRFYELLSFKIYRALKNKEDHAHLLYSEYCANAPQTRLTDASQIKAQMSKLHAPHLKNKYIAEVAYRKVGNGGESPDYIISYRPGPKAVAEYLNSIRAAQEVLPAKRSAAADLVSHFHKLAGGRANRDTPPTGKEISQAEVIIQSHGTQQAYAMVEEALRRMAKDNFKPRWFGALLSYLPQDPITSDVKAASPEAQEGKDWFSEAEARLSNLPAETRATMEAEERERLFAVFPKAKEWDEQVVVETINATLLKRVAESLP